MGDAEETTPFLLILLIILIFLLSWVGDWVSGLDTSAPSSQAPSSQAHLADAVPTAMNHTEVPRVTVGNFVHDTMVRHTLTDMR